jgi:hypothetical protein
MVRGACASCHPWAAHRAKAVGRSEKDGGTEAAMQHPPVPTYLAENSIPGQGWNTPPAELRGLAVW